MELVLFTHYLVGYVGTAVCSIGFVLALCSVYIFTRRHMRNTVSTYLACLSISDSCLLFLGLVTAINALIHPNLQNESFYSSRIHKHLFPYVYPCITWFQVTSVWITVGFAIDRWFAIKWPMLHYTYSSKRACYIVLAIYCFGFIYSLPRFFEYQTKVQHVRYNISGNLTEDIDYLIMENKVLHNRLYHYIVNLSLYSIFQSILPFLMLSYFNVELIRSINASSNFLEHSTALHVQSSRVKREASVVRHREGAITRSVICLIALFTLCQVPASVLHYLYMFYRNNPLLYMSYDISNVLIFVNSTANFFIFTYFNRRFRRELTRIYFLVRESRNTIFRVTSRLSMRRTNSSMRNAPQLSQLADITQANSWEYQTRNHRFLRQICGRTTRESISLPRKKSSDGSILSICHLQPITHHSEPLVHINLKSHRIKRKESFPIKEIYCRKQKKFSYSADKINLSMTTNYNGRYSDHFVFNHRKNSLKFHTNTSNYRGRPLHYVTYKHDKNKPTSILINSPTRNSAPAITST